MGIQGLLPFLKDVTSTVHINQFSGMVVGVDAYCWLHRGAYSCVEQLARKENTDQFVQFCMKMLQILINANVKPIMVFDGCRLPSKRETERKRRDSRQANRQKAAALLQEGDAASARKFLERSIDITPDMAFQLIRACRTRGIDYIVAPYEADAQLAYLSKHGIVDLIISEDSDLLPFGCERVLFKFDSGGNGRLIERKDLHKVLQNGCFNFCMDKFRYMCILSGCDYLDSLPGIGLGKAFKALRKCPSTDALALLRRLPEYVGSSKLHVPPDYVDDFVKANNTFLYQLVFDPIRRRLLPVNPYPTDFEPSSHHYAGLPIGDEKALQLALGCLNVNTGALQDESGFQVDEWVLRRSGEWPSMWQLSEADLVAADDVSAQQPAAADSAPLRRPTDLLRQLRDSQRLLKRTRSLSAVSALVPVQHTLPDRYTQLASAAIERSGRDPSAAAVKRSLAASFSAADHAGLSRFHTSSPKRRRTTHSSDTSAIVAQADGLLVTSYRQCAQLNENECSSEVVITSRYFEQVTPVKGTTPLKGQSDEANNAAKLDKLNEADPEQVLSECLQSIRSQLQPGDEGSSAHNESASSLFSPTPPRRASLASMALRSAQKASSAASAAAAEADCASERSPSLLAPAGGAVSWSRLVHNRLRLCAANQPPAAAPDAQPDRLLSELLGDLRQTAPAQQPHAPAALAVAASTQCVVIRPLSPDSNPLDNTVSRRQQHTVVEESISSVYAVDPSQSSEVLVIDLEETERSERTGTNAIIGSGLKARSGALGPSGLSKQRRSGGKESGGGSKGPSRAGATLRANRKVVAEAAGGGAAPLRQASLSDYFRRFTVPDKHKLQPASSLA